MTQILFTFLKIQTGEGGKVFQFALLAAVLQTGLALGISTADSLFLANVGAHGLPVVYLATPIMMFLYIAVSTYLSSRYGLERLFVLSLFCLTGGGILLYLATSPTLALPFFGDGEIIFYLAKLFATLWYIALYTLFWSFADSYFDILDARRLFSLFSAGMAFGAMVGGSLVVVLVAVLPVESLFLVWAALSLVALPVMRSITQSWPRLAEETPDLERSHTSMKRELSVISKTLRNSRYTVLLIVILLITLITSTLAEFQYMSVFQEGRSETEVASLFGRLYLAVNSFNLLVNLAVFNRLIIRFGAPVVAFFLPVSYLVAFSCLLLASGHGAALFTFFVTQGIMVSVDFNNQNFLFNALPARTKVQIRTFIEGMCEPLATAAAGLFLLAFANAMTPQALSAVAMAILALWILLTFVLHSQYMTAMVASLRETWIAFSSFDNGRPLPIESGDVAFVTQVAEQRTSEQSLTAIQILSIDHREHALELLLSFAKRSTLAEQESAAPLLDSLLQGGDAEQFRRVHRWFRETEGRAAPGLLFCAGQHHLLSQADTLTLLNSRVPDLRAVAAVSLWYNGTVEGKEKASRILHSLLSGDATQRASGAKGLCKLDQPVSIRFLLSLLNDPSQDVRKLALAAIAHLSAQGTDRILPAVLEVIATGSQSDRDAGLTILARIQDTDVIAPLIYLSATFTPRQKRKTEAILAHIGLAGVPSLIQILHDLSSPPEGKAIVARALSKLAFPQFTALATELIQTEIEHAYRCLVAGWVLSKEAGHEPGHALLARYYLDNQRLIVNFVLECLTITGRLPDFEHMAASLRSNHAKERANAIETIERGCGRKLVSHLIPLLRSRSMDEKVQYLLNTFRQEVPDRNTIIRSALTSRVPFERAAGLQASWHCPDMTEDRQEVCKDILLLPQKTSDTQHYSDPSLVRHVATSLLKRTHQSDTQESLVQNHLERIHHLTRVSVFDSLHTGEVSWLASRTDERQLTAGQILFAEGQPVSDIFLPVTGSLQHERKGNFTTIGTGELLGIDALISRTSHTSTVTSSGCSVLILPGQVIREAAEVYPQVALALFNARMGMLAQETTRQAAAETI